MVCADSIPARYVLCMLLFFGFMDVFLLRANLNLAIIAMVKAPAISAGDPLSVPGISECLLPNQTADYAVHDNATMTNSSTGGEFEWTEMQQSLVLGSFFWGYLFFQVPGGRIAEVHGTKSVYGFAIFINGILSFLLPFAAKTHWTLLLLIRALQGLAQGVVFPALNAIVVRWVPLAERARFVSFAFQGACLGAVVALPLCGWVLTAWGWEAVFFTSGALTLVWSVAWYLLVFDTPSQHPRIGPREKLYLQENLSPVAAAEHEISFMKIPWGEVFRCRQVWLGILAGVGGDWGFHTFFTLGPKYMKNALGFDLEKSSWLFSLPFLCQYVFSVFYGTLSDKMTKRLPLSVVRRTSVAFSHLSPCAGLILLSLSGCDVTLSIVVLTVSITMGGAGTSGFFHMPTDIAPNYAGLLTGVMNGLGSVTGVISTPLAGALLQSNGQYLGWRYIFLVSAAMYLLGALPYVFYYRGDIQPWNDFGSPSRTKEVSLETPSSEAKTPAEDDKKL